MFGIKFHPEFPKLVRDECDEECECGMYPSHMYDRVGVQLMADIDEPVSSERERESTFENEKVRECVRDRETERERE